MLSFQEGTRLLITNGVDRYSLLVSSVSATQTFIEASNSKKTIHSPNLVANTFATAKGAASISFSCHLTKTGEADGILFKWFGFDKVADKYYIRPLLGRTPLSGQDEKLDIYIVSSGSMYKLTTCIAQTMSLRLSRGEVLSVDITATASDLEEVQELPTTGTLISQAEYSFQNGTVVVPGYPRIAGVTCEITKNVEWVGKKSVHDIGSIYKAKTPIVTDLSVSGTITQTKTDDTNEHVPKKEINILYGDSFQILLDSCNTTDRWGLESVHKRITDYKLLPDVASSYIKF